MLVFVRVCNCVLQEKQKEMIVISDAVSIQMDSLHKSLRSLFSFIFYVGFT